MAKCGHCNSCLKTTWLDGRVYRYCTFCRTVYSVECGEISEVQDKVIIDSIRAMYGNVVE